MIRIALMSALVLSGCALGNVEKDFLCAAEGGLPCRSISEIDGAGRAKGTVLAEDGLDTQNKSITTAPLLAGKKGAASGAAFIGTGGTPYTSSRYRIPEKTGRLWVAPFRDDNEILYEGTYVHFVIREAAWGQR